MCIFYMCHSEASIVISSDISIEEAFVTMVYLLLNQYQRLLQSLEMVHLTSKDETTSRIELQWFAVNCLLRLDRECPSYTCVKGLVPSVVLLGGGGKIEGWGLQGWPLGRGGGCALKQDCGMWPCSFSFTCRFCFTTCSGHCVLPKAQSKRANPSWAETSKTVSQNKFL